jgi:HSP20 family protein
MPAIDVQQTDKEYTLKADLPGVEKKDISVQVRDNILTVSGERKSEKEEKGKNYLRREHSYGSFSRSLSLPNDVKTSEIKAAYKDGVLSLKIPRVEGAKPHNVKVEIE